jgi:hypothetical protein
MAKQQHSKSCRSIPYSQKYATRRNSQPHHSSRYITIYKVNFNIILANKFPPNSRPFRFPYHNVGILHVTMHATSSVHVLRNLMTPTPFVNTQHWVWVRRRRSSSAARYISNTRRVPSKCMLVSPSFPWWTHVSSAIHTPTYCNARPLQACIH